MDCARCTPWRFLAPPEEYFDSNERVVAFGRSSDIAELAFDFLARDLGELAPFEREMPIDQPGITFDSALPVLLRANSKVLVQRVVPPR